MFYEMLQRFMKRWILTLWVTAVSDQAVLQYWPLVAMVPTRSPCSYATSPVGGVVSPDLNTRRLGVRESVTQVVKGGRSGADTSDCGAAEHSHIRLSLAAPCFLPLLLLEIMVAKNRKQPGKSPATQTDRDKSPLVSLHGKSNVRRTGREGKASNSAHPSVLSGIRHKLGLTPSGGVQLGITLLLGKLAALAC